MNQDDNTQVDPNWLSGFCKAAAEHGLTEEQTALLLKESAHRNLLETNSKYAEGFEGEMNKSAGLGNFLARMLRKPAVGMAAGAGGLYGGSQLLDAGRYAMLDPTQRNYADRLELMRNQALGGADPFTSDLAAAQMARGGYDRTRSRMDAYKGMGFGSNNDGRSGSRDYYRRWYLE
jgi:hypothetical protein